MTDEERQNIAKRIRQIMGYGKDLAQDYAQCITDPPEIIHNRVLVRDSEGHIIARMPEAVLQEG